MSEVQAPNQKLWWTNRRRLAWFSFSVAVLQTLALGILAYFNTNAVESLGVVVAWSFALWGSIIASYIGFATWADIAATRK